VLLATVCARAFEDNNGALTLANSQRITSRTKYYHVEWHWFWSHVGKDVVILAVVLYSSVEVIADPRMSNLFAHEFLAFSTEM
jgi:hypothetical protein